MDDGEQTRIDEVLTEWLGPLDERGMADEAHVTRWFRKDPAFDARLRERFEPLYAEIARGEREDWIETPRGRLAYVIVLDQLARNIFRGTPKMFAADGRALAAAKGAIATGDDRQVGHHGRMFFYMPLMHSERIEDQDQCVELLTKWREELDGGELAKNVSSTLDYAERHRALIRRFGRFPHRNAILDRTSTADELELLQQPGSSF